MKREALVWVLMAGVLALAVWWYRRRRTVVVTGQGNLTGIYVGSGTALAPPLSDQPPSVVYVPPSAGSSTSGTAINVSAGLGAPTRTQPTPPVIANPVTMPLTLSGINFPAWGPIT